MPAGRARKHDLFQIASLLQHVVKRIAMRDAHQVLLDNRAVVENFRDVVAGGANQLHSPLNRLVVRSGADKRRQERMVDVDDALRILTDKLGRENLHIARQHDEIRRMLPEQTQDLLLRHPLIRARNRHHEVWNAIKVCDRLVVGMVGNDDRNFAGEFAALLPVE